MKRYKATSSRLTPATELPAAMPAIAPRLSPESLFSSGGSVTECGGGVDVVELRHVGSGYVVGEPVYASAYPTNVPVPDTVAMAVDLESVAPYSVMVVSW